MDPKPVKFFYLNHKDEMALRRVLLESVCWGTCPPWHPEWDYLLTGHDLDRGEKRTFALSRVKSAITVEGS